jgi:hypothetical protein
VRPGPDDALVAQAAGTTAAVNILGLVRAPCKSAGWRSSEWNDEWLSEIKILKTDTARVLPGREPFHTRTLLDPCRDLILVKSFYSA